MLVQANIHDLYVWKLSKELSKKYDSVDTNVLIASRNRIHAEIDIIAQRDGQVHVFEVKCSLRLTKARQQFKKIQKHYGSHIHKYFLYAGEADNLLEIPM